MAFLRVKDGNVKNMLVGSPDVDWLVEHIALNDTLLPEKLVVFDEHLKDATKRVLLALDKDASLVVMLIFGQAPHESSTADAAELAWDLRMAEYDQINHFSQQYFSAHGIAPDDLAELHRQHFSRDEKVPPSRFNKAQRLIVLAPEFPADMLRGLNVRRFEIDIDAYRLQTIKLDSHDELLSIEPIDALESSPLASLFSLLLEAPFKPVRKLFSRLLHPSSRA